MQVSCLGLVKSKWNHLLFIDSVRLRKIFFFFFFLLLLNAVIQFSLKAQQVNTFYFMKDIPVRHFLNPSFQPTNDIFISLPFIGFTQFYIGNNSFSPKDLLFNPETKDVLALGTQSSIDHFYNTLTKNTIIGANLQTNLLSFGFRNYNEYWTFSLSEKINGMVCLPKDLFKVALYGTTDIQKESYNFNTLQADISIYTEAAFGYSKVINPELTLGTTFKFLNGHANVSNTNNQIELIGGDKNWTIKGNGYINSSSSNEVSTIDGFSSISDFGILVPMNWLKSAGLGLGLDVGGEYQLNKKIKLSVAITDLGFINWIRNVHSIQYKMNSTFDGVRSIKASTSKNSFSQIYSSIISISRVDSVGEQLKPTVSTLTTKTYTTQTTAKLNVGVEYNLYNELSLGMLSQTQFFKGFINEELIVSVNARPNAWLNTSLSYSVFSNNVGLGLGLKTSFIHWFFAADYLFLQNFNLTNVGVRNLAGKTPIPYNSTCFNFAVGLNLVFSEANSLGLHKKRKEKSCHCY